MNLEIIALLISKIVPIFGSTPLVVPTTYPTLPLPTISVAKRVEMHVDAQVTMEEQNRGANPPNDETINVSHVSEMVGLHDDTQEANEETNVEFDLPNGEVVQQQGDAKSIIEMSNVHVNCTTGKHS
ncbi:hypothetical protein RHSIM_RhsimUnG0214500 [Rhododendron simsii]|uniref:Uncharacterized protein n=1 Tax=Rhododendron simsii TaxID=118357 RepID=A0A834FTZ6_RHOSS|nr:hypothetical protein RHSIM_RhsimUnG0214500 [Rhododendron simsii]